MMVNRQPAGSRPPAGSSTQTDRIPAPAPPTPKRNYFGDPLGPKPPNSFRGISCQLGGLPVNPTNSKYDDLLSFILSAEPDVTAMQEIGINFSNCGSEDQWKQRIHWDRILDSHKAKTIVAWNRHDHNHEKHQYGGTAILALGKTSFYAAGSGQDPTQLGRWCWTRYRGSNNTTLRIVSFYRPHNSQTNGTKTVMSQHTRYFETLGTYRNPRRAFLDDLRTETNQWIQEGDQIVLCGDINQDILSDEITEYFTSLGLRHLIFAKHPPADAPPTYIDNDSYAVDGVWASPGLDLIQGGYLDFHEAPGDHRPIWFDLSYTQSFGRSLPTVWRPQARRLQLRDPRCVERYNKLLKTYLLNTISLQLYAA